MKQVHFYALREDILPVLLAVESTLSLKYVRTGNFTEPEPLIFIQGAEIPNLGRATSESATSCDTFLVARRELPIVIRTFKGAHGEDRFCIDQLMNPDTVTFTSGGILNEDIILYGRVATVSSSDGAQVLMRQFHREIKARFTWIKACYVGPKALKCMDAGTRLTLAAQTPREFDLTREP